jgi:ribulose-5-phosphate 4-epimerase/fuculose-1-phosphate aldolase
MNEAWRAAAREFMDVAQQLWQRGLIAGSGGNISLRVPGTGWVMIKPSGMANVDCRPETLLGIDLDGAIVAGEGRPSKDVGFHLGIYRVRPDVQGIVHAHVPWSTALTLLDYSELPLLTPHAQYKLHRVPIVPYAPSGTPALDGPVTDAFRNTGTVAALLARHGLVTVGRTLSVAEELAEMVEETAQIALLVHLGGGVSTVAFLASQDLT